MQKPNVADNVSKDPKERPLLTTEVRLYHSRKDFAVKQLVITKTRIMFAINDDIQRAIPLKAIDAITLSTASPEFIIHVKDDCDERIFCSNRKRDIVEMIVYMLCNQPTVSEESGKVKMYLVGDFNLDLYVTNEEDLEDGHTIRPDRENLYLMDYADLLEYQREEEKNRDTRRNSQPLLLGEKQNVTIEDFDLLMMLGKGAHGKVLLGEKKTSQGDLYAIKILKKEHIVNAKQLEHTIAEMKILSGLSHPFLVSLRHAFHTDSKIYFVMDFMKGGELFQHMKRIGRFSEEQVKFIAACLVMALGHLHSSGFIYRDLKPENVLLDEHGYAKLTDFGLAKVVKFEDVAMTFCGTPEYMAPEIILHKGCNRPADWWSLGVLIYELLFGAPPFYSNDIQEMYKKTLVDPLRFPAKSSVSKTAMDFCAGLLVKSWTKRLGCSADSLEVMNHPWFNDFDWAKLLAMKLKPPFKPNSKKWEKNFDPQFITEEPRDSKCEPNYQILKDYEKEFGVFTYQDKDELLRRGSQTSTRGFLLAKAFRDSIKEDRAKDDKEKSLHAKSDDSELEPVTPIKEKENGAKPQTSTGSHKNQKRPLFGERIYKDCLMVSGQDRS
jgi:serum/glucocorticoid-regulated kinase 2